jgi:hypothetical protein
MLGRRPQFGITLGYHDEIVVRPTTFIDERFNPTLASLTVKMNPLDYYLEKGWELGFSIKPLRQTRLDLSYTDYLQYSIVNATDYSLFSLNKSHRINPPIADGHLRALGAAVTIDTRPLLRIKNRDDTVNAIPYTILKLQVEWADPELIDNSFDYRRYSVSLRRVQRLSGWGLTHLFAYAGTSDRALPPQRYFTFDFSDPYNMRLTDFKTLGETNFTGDRAVALYLGQDFGTTLFRKLHVPLLKDLPFSVMLYGGAFWSEFRQQSLDVPDNPRISAPDWYSEIGFGFGRLPPLLLRLYFTWQLSAYDTHDFSVKFGIGF